MFEHRYHKHIRNSLGILGAVNLPLSIIKLCEPERNREICTLSSSNEVSEYIGVWRLGLTCKYVPNFESMSVACAALILSVVVVINLAFNMISQFSAESYVSRRFS